MKRSWNLSTKNYIVKDDRDIPYCKYIRLLKDISDNSLVKIFGGSSKIFKDPPRSAKICKGLLKILEDKDLLKILTDPRGFLEDPIKIS